MLVALGLLALPVSADEHDGAVTVFLSIAEEGIQTLDPDGGAVDRVRLLVTNDGGASIVLVRVDFPSGVEAAAFQDVPPPGWYADAPGHANGRDYIVYSGVLAPGQDASFILRVVDLDPVKEFKISFDTLSAFSTHPPEPVETPPEAVSAAPTCIQLPISSAGPASMYLPVGAVAQDTSAAIVQVWYDPEHKTFIDKESDALTLHAPLTADFGDAPLAADSREFTLDRVHTLGLLDTPTGPVLTPATEGQTAFEASMATLWSGLDEAASWFAASPGRYVATSDCGTAMAFAVVPPQIDEDLDGFVSVNELRSNANPLSAASTPYSDDDCDGVPNGRDPATYWKTGFTGLDGALETNNPSC